MIELENIEVVLDGRLVLSGLNITLSERRVGVIGPNGSGKSTFARLLNGLQLPTKGKVSIDGFDTKQAGKAVRKSVGFVFQNPDNQIVYPTVEEDLAFGLQNAGLSKTELRDKVQSLLSLYGLESLLGRSTHQLSGGEKQMIALLGVLVMEPSYIVFDEPTTLLDLRNKTQLMETVHGLHQKLIFVTHDLCLLEDFDRVICLDEGQIILDGTPSEVIAKYEEMACV